MTIKDKQFNFKVLIKSTVSFWLVIVLPLSLLLIGILLALDLTSANGPSETWPFYLLYFFGFNLLCFLFLLVFLRIVLPNSFRIAIKDNAYIIGEIPSADHVEQSDYAIIPFVAIQSVKIVRFLLITTVKIRLKKEEKIARQYPTRTLFFERKEDAIAAAEAFQNYHPTIDENGNIVEEQLQYPERNAEHPKFKITFCTFFPLILLILVGSLIGVSVYTSRIEYPWYFDSLGVTHRQESLGDPNETVDVAVLDSGLASWSLPYFKREPTYYDATSEQTASFTDGTGHGTNVALLIASASTKKNSIYGVAPLVHLHIIRVQNSVGLTDTETIHKGLTYCKNQDYDIINMSFGRKSFDETIEEDLKELKEKGVILNSSVGDNKEEFTYPASSSYTYAVQTQDEDGKRDVNTNTSSTKQGILCPGENISVLRMNEEGEKVFQKDTASSYACAIFTGYVSLLMVRQKDFSLTWLDTQLKSDTLYNKDSFLGILK